MACAIPQGEERNILNDLFDMLFYQLKKDGLLHNRKAKNPKSSLLRVCETSNYNVSLLEDINGQYRLCL